MAVSGEGSLHFANVMDNSGLQRGAVDAVGIVSKMASSIAKINPFVGIGVTALASFALVSKGAYDMAKEFEKAMKEVETISGATQENFHAISEAVFALSKVSTDSPKELAEAYYQIVSAGYDGAKGLDLLAQSTKTAIAGVTDTKTAADGLTTVLNAYKLSAEDAEFVSDTMFNTVKLGKTTFEELARSISTVAPLASSSGIAFDQVASAIASLTKQGVPTAQAMTQIRSAITSLNEELADGWSDAYTLQEALQVLYDKAGGSNKQLLELVGRVETMNGVLGLAGDNAKSASEDLETFRDTVGATETATNSMLQANTNQWAIFGNRIKSYTEGIGEGWLEVSNQIATGLNKLVDDTENVTKATIKQSAQYHILKGELYGVNTAQERKLEILKELKDSYPEYLSSLDLEEISNENLNEVLETVRGTLEDINELYKVRIELAGIQDKLNNSTTKQGEFKKLYEDELVAFKINVQKAQEYADEHDIELDFSITDSPEDVYQEIFKKFEISDKGLYDLMFGDENKIVKELYANNEASKIFRKEMGLANEEVAETQKYLNAQNIALLESDKHYQNIVTEIKKATQLSQLDDYSGFTRKEITDALEVRKEFITLNKKLRQISLADYKEDKNAFDEFLRSGNDEIEALAKDRQAKLDKFLSGGTDTEKSKLTDEEKYIKEQDLISKHYDAVAKLRERGYTDDADDLAKSYDLRYNTHQQYLEAELELIEDTMKRAELIFRLDIKPAKVDIKSMIDIEKFKTDFETQFDETIESIESKTEEIVAELKKNPLSDGLDIPDPTKTNVLGFNLDKMVSLTGEGFGEMEKFSANFGESLFGVYISAQEKLAVFMENNKTAFRDMTTTQLKYVKSLNKNALTSELEKEGADPVKIKEYRQNLKDLNKELLKSADFILNQAIAGLRGAAELFRKFGNEEVAGYLDQLAGIGEGIGQIMKGDFVGGAFAILNSAITVEVEADTEKFEKNIEKLAVEIERLSRDVADSIGTSRITSRTELLEKQIGVQENLNSAIKAEEEARKAIKLIGITVGTKGAGSGTDQDKLDQLVDDLDALEHQLVDIGVQIQEIATGATAGGITSAIIQGFEDGYSTIEDFGKTFEDIMKGAMINALKVQFLEEAIKPFFAKFAEFSDGNQDGVFDLTTQEIATLKTQFGQIIGNANAQLEALNDIANEAGFAGGIFGEDENDKEGLSGSIKSITQDTAEVLAGTLNAMRIDVRNGLEVAEQSLTELKKIAENTSHNEKLNSIDDHLDELVNNLS